jgi:hypothetical protein
MQIDPMWIYVALGAVAVLVVIGLIARGSRRSRTGALRSKFGTEYDHAVHEAGSRKRAEQELVSRTREVEQFEIRPLTASERDRYRADWKTIERHFVERPTAAVVEQFEIRPLTASERDRYRADWKTIERHFVERPTAAVVEADELVADIMRVQGYPMGDFEKHAAHLSVRHPRIVEHYRSGHRVIGGAAGSASTEDLRQAMLHYRALFEELIGDRVADVEAAVPRANEVVTREARELPEETPVRPDISR